MLVERHPLANLDTAIMLLDRMRCAELKGRAAAVSGWGHCSRSRLALMMLDEVRLILRVLRRYEPACFVGLMADIQAACVVMPIWRAIRPNDPTDCV